MEVWQLQLQYAVTIVYTCLILLLVCANLLFSAIACVVMLWTSGSAGQRKQVDKMNKIYGVEIFRYDI